MRFYHSMLTPIQQTLTFIIGAYKAKHCSYYHSLFFQTKLWAMYTIDTLNQVASRRKLCCQD